MSSHKVSVIILNYNGMEYVDACLSGVLGSEYENFEVIFVDNNSSDGSAPHVLERLGPSHQLKLIVLPKNYGFAGGNNFGLRRASGEFIVFLNIDTCVDRMWLSAIVKVMTSDESIGACQSKLLLMDDPNRLDSAGGFLYSVGYGYERGDGEIDRGQYNHVDEIVYAKGASLCVRRSILEQVGWFDEVMFLRGEETDLCWRIWLAGYRVVFVPGSIVYHKRGGLLPSGSPLDTYYTTRNRWYLIIKNHELKSILKYVLPLLLVEIHMLLKRSGSREVCDLKAFIKGLIWPIMNLPLIVKARKDQQHIRRVCDARILGRVTKTKNPILLLMGH